MFELFVTVVPQVFLLALLGGRGTKRLLIALHVAMRQILLQLDRQVLLASSLRRRITIFFGKLAPLFLLLTLGGARAILGWVRYCRASLDKHFLLLLVMRDFFR